MPTTPSTQLEHTMDEKMKSPSPTSVQRPEPGRSATWPLSQASPSTAGAPPTDVQAFQDDLEEHPERHFLSPMTADEVYGWDSDSEDGDDGGEWLAGITDFSLFAADRKRAIEAGEALDEKWDSFMSNQAEAFERSCERVRNSQRDSVPALTPDTSPDLKDNLEEDAELEDGKMVLPQIRVPAMPDYLTVEVKPEQTNRFVGPDDELPLSFALARKKRVERPGLRHARTMSGRRHVWRRPEMRTVDEDADAETAAEREDEETDSVPNMASVELGAVASAGVH